MAGSSSLTRDKDAWVWTMTIDALPPDSSTDQDAAEMTGLFGDRLQVALREGKFTKAEGFDINPDGRIALLKGDLFEATHGEGAASHTLKLVWDVR